MGRAQLVQVGDGQLLLGRKNQLMANRGVGPKSLGVWNFAFVHLHKLVQDFDTLYQEFQEFHRAAFAILEMFQTKNKDTVHMGQFLQGGKNGHLMSFFF